MRLLLRLSDKYNYQIGSFCDEIIAILCLGKSRMDILDKLLTFAQISAGVSVKCQLQGDWQLDNPYQNGQAVAHIISSGVGYLYYDEKTYQLQQGDIVFFPKSADHTLRSQIKPLAHNSIIKREPLGGFTLAHTDNLASECDMFCLHFHYQSQSELMESLPEIVILKVAETPLAALVEMLKTEANSPGFASTSVVNSLALVILAMILREYLSNNESDNSGVLKGWQDARLRPLLRAILLYPEKSWQVEEMAELAHLSRSQLIRVFNKHVGISPHAFVHRIRLQKAAMLLKSQADTVLSIALSCGFQSEPHFIAAFKKYYDKTPSQYRQNETK